MFTTECEVVIILAAFVLGATEGQRFFAWVKSWFAHEVTAVENKITGHSGPTGA